MTIDRALTWEALLAHAIDILDATPGIAGDWTLGGGTVLMRRYRHRISKDIDIFVSDPQLITAVSPRLNSVAEDKTSEYVEQSGFVKLYFESGEIDFIAAPPLTRDEAVPETVLGRTVRVETDAEIVAKKIEYRGDVLRARDLFDLACVLDNNAAGLTPARQILTTNSARVLERLRVATPALEEDFNAIDALDFQRTFPECIDAVRKFLANL